jgi:hypothetical protein
MPAWKQLTLKTMPPRESEFWVNLDNACSIGPGTDGVGAHIEFVSIDPVDVRETPDQIVTATGNWKACHLGGPGYTIFVNLANITTFDRFRSVRGGQLSTFISFALAPSHLGPGGTAEEPSTTLADF